MLIRGHFIVKLLSSHTNSCTGPIALPQPLKWSVKCYYSGLVHSSKCRASVFCLSVYLSILHTQTDSPRAACSMAGVQYMSRTFSFFSSVRPMSHLATLSHNYVAGVTSVLLHWNMWDCVVVGIPAGLEISRVQERCLFALCAVACWERQVWGGAARFGFCLPSLSRCMC